MNKFDTQYFLDKFSKIPANKWTTGDLNDGHRCCALGHCGVQPVPRKPDNWKLTLEARALEKILAKTLSFKTDWKIQDLVVPRINDNQIWAGNINLGKTPRTRILNALKLAQKRGI